MKKIRDVLRLTHALGLSRRKVGEATGIGRTAVTDYVSRAASAGLSWALPDELDDTELERRLYPPAAPAEGAVSIEPDWATVHAEMKRRGVTMTLLWQEYRAAPPLPDVNPNIAEIYRHKVQHLSVALADPTTAQEATTVIRSLIGEIVLTPGGKRGEVHATLRGELMSILDFAAGRNEKRTNVLRVITAVASSPRNYLYRTRRSSGSRHNNYSQNHIVRSHLPSSGRPMIGA